ncbi:MAG: methylated-DNA--[protein]-cysteine S-methyltransferase [Clostridiales bacterium]|nr:methylated-DNA--[protein]-cysteine S-methyltransferase [Clostridiales bacterium]
MYYTAEYSSPVGRITLASDGENIVGLWLEGQKYFAATLDGEAREASLPVLEDARRWLDIYFSGKEPDFQLPLAPRGSEFRQTVWGLLLEIPYGKTVTYGELSKKLEAKLGRKTSARAVGGAVGHNPISIIIPCHRVVGTDGSLTGYAGGVDKKIQLLRLEGAEI